MTFQKSRLWRVAAYALAFVMTFFLTIALVAAFAGCARPTLEKGPFVVYRAESTEAEMLARVNASSVTIAVSFITPQGKAQGGTGSGVVVWRAGRMANVLTARHVIARPNIVSLVVMDSSGEARPALLEAEDAKADLALLAWEPGPLERAVPVATTLPPLYSRVYVVAAPGGYVGTATAGFFSGFDSFDESGAASADPHNGEPMMRVTGALVYPGASGGAIVDTEGRLVGVADACTMLRTPPGSSDVPVPQLGFAVPLPTVREFLVKHGVPL